MPDLTRGQKVNADITALIQARNTLLWIVSREEERVEAALFDSLPKGTKIRFWDCATGLTEKVATKDPASSQMRLTLKVLMGGGAGEGGDPQNVLAFIRRTPDRCLYVMRDLNAFKDPLTIRAIRSLARDLGEVPASEARTIVILTSSNEVHPDLMGSAILLDYPLPDREEITRVFNTMPLNPEKVQVPSPAVREAAIDAALGMTVKEAANSFSKSLVTLKCIDPALISGEKKRVIAREKVLTWVDADSRGMNGVGGLEVVKGWLKARKTAFSVQARDYGLPSPKGILLAGIPGTGKSLVAKCVAASWNMPLLKLDLGALQSKWIGESQANIRKALQVAETVSPCVVWLDEVEKALSGSTGSQGDGGVAADALGAILNWMQERVGACFVVATCNDPRVLPPELLRKGRFDELFWVDLPTAVERKEILKAALAQYLKRPVEGIELGAVVKATEAFTGAEIASIVPAAMFEAFADNAREINAWDLLTATKTVVPLSRTAKEKLDELRTWAKEKARMASLPEIQASVINQGVDLDL
jgi:SpoVK/Ycf46/Vps4 family AAA+-type ATPase